MIIIDQLRVSDDGKKMYLNAHVNKARYFDEVFIDKITICTEDQVSETNPQIQTGDYVYQKEFNATDDYVIYPIYNKTQVLSEDLLLNIKNEYGGWSVSFTSKENSTLNGISITFSGKFSVFDTGHLPKLIITAPDFIPAADGSNLNDVRVLHSIEGIRFEKEGHTAWIFKGKDYIDYDNVCFYLYKQTSDGVYELVHLDDTDNKEFLHFYWNAYSYVPTTHSKEINMVFTPSMFNEKFSKTTFSDNMFFVYIECKGTPSSDTPCTLDEKTTLGVTFDYGLFYNQAMNYTRELVNTCSPSQQFIDFILNVEALKLGIETEHYIPAIQRWKWLKEENKKGTVGNVAKSCGCHG